MPKNGTFLPALRRAPHLLRIQVRVNAEKLSLRLPEFIYCIGQPKELKGP